MGVFEMVVLVVLIGTVGSLLENRSRMKSRFKDLESQLDRLGVSRQLERVDELEERMRTLERIVTDRSYRLRDEIDGL